MYIVIHYSEIGLKGKNRTFFEKKLVQNIGSMLKGVKSIYRRYGKIIVEIEGSAKLETHIKTLSFLPGISSFAFAERSELKMENIKKVAFHLFKGIDFETFRITTRRSNKQFPKTSGEINIILGDLLRVKLGKRVDLANPDVTLFVEISEREVLLYAKKYYGISGLPVSSSGKVVASLSGGIDSPVASFLAAKRGLKVVFCHILNKTMGGSRGAVDKVENIVKKLTNIQGDSKIYIIPFAEIQKVIIENVPADYRMIIYRRFMMKIMEKVAKIEKAGGIVTGDSVGQVASQTLSNLKCIYSDLDLPVLPPLIGMNKEEIIKIAREIETYNLSILPHPDCCSFMIAKHPQTKALIGKIRNMEDMIADKDRLIENSVNNAQVKSMTSEK